MKKFTAAAVLLALIVSVLGVAYYAIIVQPRAEMMTRLLSHFPDGYGNPDDPQTWEVIILVRQRKLEDMAKPGYREREQEKMAQMGFDITLTEEMVQRDRKRLSEEVQFAQERLNRIQTGDTR